MLVPSWNPGGCEFFWLTMSCRRFLFVRAVLLGMSLTTVTFSWRLPFADQNNQAMKVDITVLGGEVPPSPSPAPRTFACTVCEHVYNPLTDCGGKENPAKSCGADGVPFTALPSTWRCPVCGALKAAYHQVAGSDGIMQWTERP
jgi:rubredoxin